MRPIHFILASTALLSLSAQARVIYGEDNRLEVSQASSFHQSLARSSATMVSAKAMKKNFLSATYQLDQRTLKDWLESTQEDKSRHKMLFSADVRKAAISKVNFCEGERFTDQPNPGMCSGFLIAPDLIVTAGHCVTEPDVCSEYRWVFDFKVDPVSKKAGKDIDAEDIYSCKKIVSNALNMNLGLDYAVIQLDRSVKNREPLTIRSENMIENYTNLVVIGSPSGLPQKVSGGATVRKNTHPFYFVSNLDSFQGNSGSPVFDAKTGMVEGILVRGEEDFKLNTLKRCVEAVRCKDSECRGEDVSRMTSIPEIGLMNTLHRAAVSGDMTNLRSVLKLNFWVDIYGKDRQSALLKAAQNLQVEAVTLLLSKGADVNLQDVNGNTALHLVAASNGANKQEIIKTLVDAGADSNIVNNKGEKARI